MKESKKWTPVTDKQPLWTVVGTHTPIIVLFLLLFLLYLLVLYTNSYKNNIPCKRYYDRKRTDWLCAPTVTEVFKLDFMLVAVVISIVVGIDAIVVVIVSHVYTRSSVQRQASHTNTIFTVFRDWVSLLVACAFNVVGPRKMIMTFYAVKQMKVQKTRKQKRHHSLSDGGNSERETLTRKRSN